MSGAPSLDLALEAPDSPLEEGRARRLELSVRAGPGPAVVLESVQVLEGRASFADAPAHSWRRRPDGVVLYDAAQDRYVHSTALQAVGAVPLHSGVVPPSGRASTFVPVRFADAGRRRVVLVVSYRALPPEEGPARLYLPPERGVQGATVIYSLGREPARRLAHEPPGLAIVRETDLPRLEARLEVDVDVVAGADSPAAVRAHGPPLGRSRGLGGAWVVRTPRGVAVLGPEGELTLADAAVLDHLDALVLDDPVVVVFRGERALAVREGLGLPRGQVQAALAPERALELLGAAARAGVDLRVGQPWEGLVAGSG